MESRLKYYSRKTDGRKVCILIMRILVKYSIIRIVIPNNRRSAMSYLSENNLYENIQNTVAEAQQKVYVTVNFVMVETYWNVSKQIKSDSVVKYTLPEDNNQIFASKYKLYIPTEEELKRKLEK